MTEEIIPSFNEQLKALRKGESLARAERFFLGDHQGKEVNEALARMRRTVNAAVSRIRTKLPGSNFRVESGSMITSDNEAIMAVVTVSRFV